VNKTGKSQVSERAADLGDNDVHLTTKLLQSVHQLFRVTVNADPATIHKDLCCTGHRQHNHSARHFVGFANV